MTHLLIEARLYLPGEIRQKDAYSNLEGSGMFAHRGESFISGVRKKSVLVQTYKSAHTAISKRSLLRLRLMDGYRTIAPEKAFIRSQDRCRAKEFLRTDKPYPKSPAFILKKRRKP